MLKRFTASIIILCTVLFCLAETVSDTDKNNLNIVIQPWFFRHHLHLCNHPARSARIAGITQNNIGIPGKSCFF